MTREKILITSQKLMGDLIVQTAAFASLRKAFPSAQIIVLCEERIAVALSTNTDIDEVWGVPFAATKQARGLRGFWLKTVLLFAWAFRIRRFRFTRVLVTDYSDKACLWAFFSGAKIRGGLKNQSMSFLLNHRLFEQEGSRDYIDFYLSLARLIGGSPGERRTKFPLPATAPGLKTISSTAKKPFIVIHPGASAENKRWPAKNWAGLIAAIARLKPAENFILVSGPGESGLCRAIYDALPVQKLRSRTLILCERPLLETAVLMQNAEIVFCLDSASRHLAAALKVPSISLITSWIIPTWGLYSEKESQFIIAVDAPRDSYDISLLTVKSVLEVFKRARRQKTQRPKS